MKFDYVLAKEMNINWEKYLETDFGNIEEIDGENMFHVDGYVYYAEDSYNKETPYRAVQFTWCYVPLDKRKDKAYVGDLESECKQYIEDMTEEKAKETILWYLANCEIL